MNRQATEWEEIFAAHESTKDLYLEYAKNSYSAIIR